MMFDSELPYRNSVGSTAPPALPRADSQIRATFAAGENGTYVSDVFERGSFRIRFPRGSVCEGALLNTGGGITGGDRLLVELQASAGADLIVTSQAAEKLYRSDGASAVIAMRARLAAGARLDWLPQESILFDGANITRTLDIEMADDAALTVLEVLVLGRAAFGERLTNAHWCDRWRITRDGRLVLAENVRLDGALAEIMRGPATGSGAGCVATLVHIAPDAEGRLEAVRAALVDGGCDSLSAASSWNGMLLARFAARDLGDMRKQIADATIAITRRALPRAWSC